MGCEPYKTLSLYLHLLWNPCSLQVYHIVKLYQNYIITEQPAELKRFNCSESICLCANPAYSCFVSPKAARIHVSLWRPPLSKAEKIMSLSWCSCTKIDSVDAPKHLPLLCFLQLIGLFTSPTVTSLSSLQRMPKDLSLSAYAGYSSKCFHP